MTFRNFLEQKEISKPWVARKDEVMKLWNSVKADAPLQVRGAFPTSLLLPAT